MKKRITLLVLALFLTLGLSACTGDLETLIDDVDTSVTTVETSVADLETDLAAANAAIAALQLELDAAATSTEVGLVESDVDDLNDEITALETQIAALEAELAYLQSLTDKSYDEIIIMHTNDIHGTANYDSWRGMGYANISTMVKNVREMYGYTYLVDAGDNFHGTTFATLEEGESMVQVMNAVGYDLMVPGNHDFDYGQDRLLELAAMADFPLISANIQYDADDTDMFDGYYIEMFGDVKVGFFGLTSPETTYKTHPDNVTGLNFLDPVTQAQAMVTMLEGMEVDVIICLAHIGLDESTEVTTEDIATAVDGIDVIIDGHSHSLLEDGMVVNGTLIASAGEYGEVLGAVEIVVAEDGTVTATVMELDSDVAPDVYVQTVIDLISLGQAEILNEEIGSTAVVLDGARELVRTGETNLGKIIADSMVLVSDADVAITNGGGIRADIQAGVVTRGDVITVLPFGNLVVTVELTGEEIVSALEYGTSSAPSSSGKFPHVSGITYTLDLNAAAGSRVTNVMINGVAVDLTATYTVATNDFLAAGGDGYDVFEGKDIAGEFMGLHEALELMFPDDADITVPTDTRVTIIPVVE